MARRLRCSLLIVVGLVGLLALPGCGARFNYTVGVTSATVVDGTRSTPARGTTPAHAGRTLPTTIYYPDDDANAPYPLVVFAHGFNVTPAYYDPLLRYLASTGYVVAAPEFPISTPNGSGPARRDDIVNQPGDVSAVITYMTQQWDYRFLVIGSLVGVVGHSDGGITAAGMAMVDTMHDGRVHTYAVLSGAIPGGVGNIVANDVPLLIMNGTDDTVNPPAATPGGEVASTPAVVGGAGGGATSSPALAQSIYNLAAPPKAYTRALGGGHTAPFIGTGDQADVVRWALADFLNVFLRGNGESVPFFQGDANWDPYTATVSAGIGG